MKKFSIYLLVSLIGVFLFANNFNNEDIPYYWEGEKKHYYEIDDKIVLIEFTIDGIDEPNINVAFPEAETYRIKNDTTLQLITRSKLSLLDKLSDKKDIIQHPAIKVKGTNSSSFITDEISVLFKSKKSESEVIAFADKLNLEYLTETSYGTYLFRVLEGGRTIAIANFIQENNEEVVWSNPNFVHLISLFNDPLYPDQYYLNNSGQGGGTANIDINAPEAWGISFGCDEIRVAVIDDGVENHEDFDGRVLAGFTAGGNNTGGVPLNDPSKGHGLACAGIISATHDNEIGIKGVAPNSQIIPINIFPNIPNPINNPAGAATNAEIATAINWAWRPDRGNAHVLSNSWGGGNPNIDVTTEIINARTIGRDNLGAIVIFSSGNSHQTFSGVNYPATINGVITVGAINRNGNIWNYSSRGSQMDLVAPSGNLGGNGDVVTTDREGALGYDPGNYTDGFGGTSAAAPQVAGVAALMLSVNPNLTEAQVRTILQQTATDMGSAGFDNTFGFGRVNAFAAVRAAAPIVGPDLVCASGAIFSIGSPAGSTVTWTASPAHLFSQSSGQGNTTPPVSPASSSARGMGTLTFSVTGECGEATFAKEVFIGTPNASLIVTASHWGPPIVREIDPSTTTFAEATYNQVPVPWGHNHFTEEYDWDIWNTHSNWSIVPQHGGGPPFNAAVEIDLWHNPLPAQQTIYVRVRNPCGWSLWQETFWDVVGSCGFCAFTVYPNPAAEELRVRLDDSGTKTADDKKMATYTIRIYGESGNLVWEKETDSREEHIPTAGWREGIYQVRIHHPEGEFSQKVIVRH